MSTPAQWIWMQQLFGVGARRAHEALEKLGEPSELLSLSEERIACDSFLTEDEKKTVLAPNFSKARALLSQGERLGWTPLTPSSPLYPKRLRTIHSMPYVLWAQGNPALLSEPYPVAMVGSREADEYGCRAARKISTELALCGGVVVSGLARGIDTVCHESALAVGGKTIAFLATGPDGDYPKESHALREKIAQKGLLLTEFAPGTPVRPSSFHIRNRLLSGISLAVVVAQAARRSGSLLTAGHALAQDRDLYAVCGDIFSPKMAGCHELLADGASPVFSGVSLLRGYESVYGAPLQLLCPEERIASLADPAPSSHPAAHPEEYRIPPKKRPAAAQQKPAPAAPKKQGMPLSSLTEKQERVYRACEGDCPFDTLCEAVGLPAGETLSILTQLEIFGLVQSLPGRRYRSV